MNSVELKGKIDSERKILMILYWINKKTAINSGCDTFIISQINTKHTSYLPQTNESIKLSNILIRNLIKCIKMGEIVEFQIRIGNNDIKTSFQKNIFLISTGNSNELETEIIEKIKIESKKKFPNICSKFYKRMGLSIG
jgi:hypothetical protein